MEGRAHQLYRTDRKVETTHFNIFAGETSLLLSQFKIKHLHILGPPNLHGYQKQGIWPLFMWPGPKKFSWGVEIVIHWKRIALYLRK